MERWDKETQQPHGGQDWRNISNFVSDFSVTTNGLGTPASGVAAAAEALKDIHHYPAADFEPAKTELAKFLCHEDTAAAPEAEWHAIHERLLLGNGASELIDLTTRFARPGGFKSGSSINQYKEYERASKAVGRHVLAYDAAEDAAITAIINPNNPTGEWMELEELKQFIVARCAPGSTVMVDESMQPWVGPDWRRRGLLAAAQFIRELHETKQIHVFLMHSWTKLWSCPGVRLGSILCPTREVCLQLKSMQVPWSVNSMALAFLEAVVHDRAYINDTHQLNPAWRKRQVDFLTANFPSWKLHGPEWISWIWCELPDHETQERLIKVCRDAGTPIRGDSGYNMPNFVRFGVRKPEEQDVLFAALSTLL